MGVLGKISETLLKRTSTFTLIVVGGAFLFERTFDILGEKAWRAINKGKLWDDIKHKYE